MKITSKSASNPTACHCEERSDAAIQLAPAGAPRAPLAGKIFRHCLSTTRTLSFQLSALSPLLLIALTALALLPGARAESLWPAAGRGPHTSMFADRKAASVGDILTIVVSESVAASNSQSTKSSRDSSVSDAVSSFFYPSVGTHKGALPSLSLSGKASSSGGGDISNNQSLSARAAVLVSDVLPNGNLVIEGMRVVTFSGETQYVVLHGLVRSDDIAPDNTIASSNIADARLEFYTEGQLTDAQKRGWFSKLYEKLRPF